MNMPRRVMRWPKALARQAGAALSRAWHNQRPLIVLVVGGLVMQGATVTLAARLVDTLRVQVLSQCAADKSIGDLAKYRVTLNPATRKPSRSLLVIIATHGRAFDRLECHGHLAPASPSYQHWTKVYQIPQR